MPHLCNLESTLRLSLSFGHIAPSERILTKQRGQNDHITREVTHDPCPLMH